MKYNGTVGHLGNDNGAGRPEHITTSAVPLLSSPPSEHLNLEVGEAGGCDRVGAETAKFQGQGPEAEEPQFFPSFQQDPDPRSRYT